MCGCCRRSRGDREQAVVYTAAMKSVTLSADEALLDAAEEYARARESTLEAAFQEWLEDFVARERRVAEAMEVIHDLQQRISTGGRKFTRDELNER